MFRFMHMYIHDGSNEKKTIDLIGKDQSRETWQKLDGVDTGGDGRRKGKERREVR